MQTFPRVKAGCRKPPSAAPPKTALSCGMALNARRQRGAVRGPEWQPNTFCRCKRCQPDKNTYLYTMTTAPPRLYRGQPIVRMHVMIKATGPICNLHCDYCYYLSKSELLSTDSHWIISDEILEQFIKQYIQQQNAREVVFSWQGGETTLLGLDFFKKVVALEKKYAPPHIRCENDLQTNGTLLNDEWCAFLKENNFLVGLSVDGPKNLHDAYRKYNNGRGSFDDVCAAAEKLNKHHVRFATLTVVNQLNSHHPLEVYRFLRDVIKSRQMQFIPIVEPKNYQTTAPQKWDPETLPYEGSPETDPTDSRSFLAPWSVSSETYGDFLIAVFEEWRKHDLGRLFIPFFDSAVEQWMGKPSPLCIFSPICGKGTAMEHNGDVYACDHYVYPDYRLGNITQDNLSDMLLSEDQKQFGYAKDYMLPGKCRSCDYLFACSGECKKNRFVRCANGEPGLNYLCQGLHKYFSHIDPYIRTFVHQLGGEVHVH